MSFVQNFGPTLPTSHIGLSEETLSPPATVVPSKGMPLFSVVIPAFDREFEDRAFSKKCFGDFELIVVDDASRDGTAAAVRAFGDSRVQLIHQDSNRGVGAARNTGILSSR